MSSQSAAAGATDEPIPDTEQAPPKEPSYEVDVYEANYGQVRESSAGGHAGGTMAAATHFQVDVEVAPDEDEVAVPAGVRVSGV